MTFATALQLDLHHGLCLGVQLPLRWSGDCEAALEALPAAERDYAGTLGERRRIGFVGGRVALRRAALQLGFACPAVPVGAGGAPQLPTGLQGSISHKPALALALVERSAPNSGASIGVDVEALQPARAGVARRVLGADELAQVERLPADQRWAAVLERFSVKEAIYKALYPQLRRLVGFDEVAVWPGAGERLGVELRLQAPVPDLAVEASCQRLGDLVLSTARARRP